MVYQEYQVSYMRSNNDWKLPLNLAIGFHIMVALTALYLPMLFESKPKFTDVYTVNLVNLSEPAAPAAAPAPAQAPAPAKAPPKAPPKMIEKTAAPVKIPPKTQVAPIAEAKPVEAAPPAPPKAISLKPVKKKVKNKVIPPDDTVQREQEKREKEVERQNRQQLAESLRAEQTAIEEARLAAEEAEAERRLMEATQERLAAIRSQASSSTATQTPSGPSGGTTNALDAQYAAAVAARIQPFFQLPEIKTFDPSLVTVVVITINSNGEIADTRIEAGSGDAIYDQFVLKSLEAANPLPAIPPALRRQRIELGLKFSPSGIR
jgi:colicin import membrane protein